MKKLFALLYFLHLIAFGLFNLDAIEEATIKQLKQAQEKRQHFTFHELKGNVDVVLNRFHHYVQKTTHKLDSRSKIAQTARGPIEYAKKGKGPLVLCIHGLLGGFDQALLIGSSLIEHGFTVLAPSRPGYLRTPLSVGQTNEEQADAMAALLDALGIDKVSVIGFSAGSQIAFLFAVRYPHRVHSVVFESLGAPTHHSALYALYKEILAFQPILPDFASWLFYLLAQEDQKRTVKFLLSLDARLPSKEMKKRAKSISHDQRQMKFALKLIASTMPLNSRIPGIENDLSALNQNPWPEFDLTALKRPTMVIQSKFDSNNSFPPAMTAAKQIPLVKIIRLHKCGHFIWLGEEKEKWEQSLRKFLKSQLRKKQ